MKEQLYLTVVNFKGDRQLVVRLPFKLDQSILEKDQVLEWTDASTGAVAMFKTSDVLYFSQVIEPKEDEIEKEKPKKKPGVQIRKK